MEMNIMSLQISGTTSPPSHQPVRYVVRQRTVDHLQRNSPRATNRPHSANLTHSGDLPCTIHSQKTLPSQSIGACGFTSPQANQHDSESFAALRRNLKVCIGSYRKIQG